MTPIDESQLSICDPAPGPDEGKIVICDPGPEPDERKIVICPPECGPDIPDLTISGTNTPTVGSSYTATGGKPPYTWSISAGAIDLLGKITSLDGTCGTGSVTVTDDCGTTATMAVRFPSGQWVLQSQTADWECAATDFGYIAIETSGKTKTETLYCALPVSSPYTRPCEGMSVPCCNYCTLVEINSYFAVFGLDTTFKTINLDSVRNYSWECP